MYEVLNDLYARERHVTRAQIMHELNHELNRGIYRVDMPSEGNVSNWLSEVLGQPSDLSEWIGDIFDAFRINKENWPDHVVSSQKGKEADDATSVDIARQDLADALREKTYVALGEAVA